MDVVALVKSTEVILVLVLVTIPVSSYGTYKAIKKKNSTRFGIFWEKKNPVFRFFAHFLFSGDGIVYGTEQCDNPSINPQGCTNCAPAIGYTCDSVANTCQRT